MKRGLRGPGAEARCIFSGARGEVRLLLSCSLLLLQVCTLEPLLVAPYPGHPLSSHSILALATISKVIVITVRPRLKVIVCVLLLLLVLLLLVLLQVLMTASLTGDPHTLPLLSWQFVVIQNPSFNRVVDPVLTFARDRTIHFYQVTRPQHTPLVKIPLESRLVRV